MSDAFISYASKDDGLAKFVHEHLKAEGVSSFLASVSIAPGERWSPTVLNELRASQWVIFLASRAACQSGYVQQELGVALGSNKKIVPVIWEIQASELPGWANQFQAIDLRHKTIDQARTDITGIAERIKSNNRTGLLILGAIVGALLKFA
jgi:hypothetical protein